MTLELINPEELPTPESYTQVVAATGSRLVFVAGQVADDAKGNDASTRMLWMKNRHTAHPLRSCRFARDRNFIAISHVCVADQLRNFPHPGDAQWDCSQET